MKVLMSLEFDLEEMSDFIGRFSDYFRTKEN
jgi:hypothetical protein